MKNTNIVLAGRVEEYTAFIKRNLLRQSEYRYVNEPEQVKPIPKPITIYDLGGHHPNRKAILDALSSKAPRFVYPRRTKG